MTIKRKFRFKEFCQTKTGFESLNLALKRLGKNQSELLLYSTPSLLELL